MPSQAEQDMPARLAALRETLRSLSERISERSSELMDASRTVLAATQESAARVAETRRRAPEAGRPPAPVPREPVAQPALAEAAVAPLVTEIDSLRSQLEGLQTAMETRAVIEQAKGMIMLRERVSADQAFQILVAMSQRSHRKLREVAELLVERAVQTASTRTAAGTHSQVTGRSAQNSPSA